MTVVVSVSPTVQVLELYPPRVRKNFALAYLAVPPENIIDLVLKQLHTSVLEFGGVVFYVKCSRATSHQLVRHRVASYWQYSQRYRKQAPEFIVPRSLLRLFPVDQLFSKLYETYVLLREQKKLSKEFARYVLPEASATWLVVYMNFRELHDVFLPLRMCRRSQAEIRYIAIKLWLEIQRKTRELQEQDREEILKILQTTGPRCVIFGRCPEYGFTDLEQCRKCREAGYREAIMEHGTDEEIEKIDEIIQALP